MQWGEGRGEVLHTLDGVMWENFQMELDSWRQMATRLPRSLDMPMTLAQPRTERKLFN